MRDVVDVMEDDSAGDDVSGLSRWPIALLGLMLRRPQDTLAATVASAALLTILVNALYLQPNPHPAPLFSVRPKPRAAATVDPTGGVAVLPRRRPSEIVAPRPEPATKPAAAPAPATRTRSDIVTDIQRELSRRGLYDGAIDGILGSRTDAAIRGLARATGTNVGVEPGEAMLQAILRAPAGGGKITPARHADPIGDLVVRTTAAPAPPAPQPAAAAPTPVAPSEPSARPGPNTMPVRPEPTPGVTRSELAALPSRQEASAPAGRAGADASAPPEHPVPRADLPTQKVKALQRALSEFGYGQLKPTGTVDAATAVAIKTFEEARDLPVTGQVSDRMVEELAMITGRAIE